MKHDLPSFALLIDADNVRQENLTPILEEITLHARLTVRRIYGDFTAPNLAGWKGKLAEHAIHPIQQYRNSVGKNASDSALIIDAMDLLHSRRFEGFCLVSSDSDFTRLATRIREDGLVVFGFGEKKAPKAFVSACDRYIYVENLLAQQEAAPAQTESTDNPAVTTPAPPFETKEASSSPSQPPRPTASSTESESPPAREPGFLPPALAVNLLMRANASVADDLGWAMLGQMSSYIHANHPDFDPRSYGCTKFIELVEKSSQFELEQRPYKNGQVHYCRPRNTRQPPSSADTKSRKAFNQGVIDAAKEAGGDKDWAAVSMIGQKLKARGLSIKGSGHSTLTKALQASGVFEMKGVGATRYFRLKRPV